MALALWIVGGTFASADTLTPSQYQARLTQARSLATQASRESGAERARLLRSARDLLARTDALSLPDGSTYPARDTAIVEAIDRGDEPARIIEMLDFQSLAARSTRPVDAAAARERLRQIASSYQARESRAGLADLIVQFIARFLAGLGTPPLDLIRVMEIVGAIGIPMVLLILALLGRGLRERIRRDTAVLAASGAAQADPRRHLAAADAAIAARRPREAIHALYLYALTTLAARELIRYDPSLTDGELLLRTAALPQARELRDLVALYERSWFGLRDPGDTEMARARELAVKVAA